METDTLYEDSQDLNEKLRINVVGNYAQGKSIFSRRLLVNRTVDKAYNETGENNYSTSNFEKKNVSEQTSWIDLGAALLNERENEENESSDEKDWKKCLRAPTVLHHEFPFTDLGQDVSKKGSIGQTSLSSLKHRVQDKCLTGSGVNVVAIAGLYRTGKSYLLNRLSHRCVDGWVVGEALNGPGKKSYTTSVLCFFLKNKYVPLQTLVFDRKADDFYFKFLQGGINEEGNSSQKQMFELKVPDKKYTLLTSEVEHFSTIACLENQMIENGRSRMERYMMNIFMPLLDLDHTILDGNDWKKYLWAPTCLRHELLLTDSRQDDSQIGAREKTSKSSGEKEWTNPPRAATNLLRVSAVTIIYSISDVGQIGQGEQKSKSSGEKEWMNHPRAANILLRVSAETFIFSSGDVDKKGPNEKKSKSSNVTEGLGVLKQNPKALQEFDEYDKIIRCCVCLHEDACVLFFPCRHMTTCEGCADIVTDCPLCRLRIKGTVKINVV